MDYNGNLFRAICNLPAVFEEWSPITAGPNGYGFKFREESSDTILVISLVQRAFFTLTGVQEWDVLRAERAAARQR
jgi:hypothetical protein